jgi:hypothetical protein
MQNPCSQTFENVNNEIPFAASAANQPVPMTSESVSRLGIKSSEGIFGVATRVPVREGDAQQSGLCASHELAVLAGQLVSNLTGATGVVGRAPGTIGKAQYVEVWGEGDEMAVLDR